MASGKPYTVKCKQEIFVINMIVEEKKTMSAIEAMHEAQKIAFAPIFFQAVVAMKKLGILKVMAQHRKGITLAELSEKTGVSRYGVGVLLEAAESANIVEYKNENTVALTMTGTVLNSDLLTDVNINFVNDVCYDGAKYLTDCIKTGKPEGLKTLGNWPTVYEGLSQLPDQIKKSWFEFDHYYSDNAFPDALKIVFAENPKLIFDIGGNTGKWALACCKYNANVRIKILDLAGQLNVSKKNAAENNFLDRIDFHQINLLDESQKIPQGADAIWMSQFLDCFSEDEIVAILKNVKQASSAHTHIYIMETFIDNQRFEAANYALTGTSLYFTIIANGNSKMYKLNVMKSLIEKAGLKLEEEFPLIGNSFHTILKCKA